MIPHAVRYAFYVLLVGIAIGVGIYTHLDREAMHTAFVYCSFYIVMALVLTSIATWVNDRRKRSSPLLPAPAWLATRLVPALLLASFIFLTVEPKLRVLSDEAKILALSRSLFESQEARLPYEAELSDTGLQTTLWGDVKRPLFFPFLTSIVHATTGYRAGNVYVVNFLALTVIFTVVIDVFLRRTAWPGAWAAALLIAAQPVVSLCATSGGFDTVQLLFMVLVLSSLAAYLRDPRESRFRLLWVLVLLLLQVRYEGLLYAGVLMSYLLVFRLASPMLLTRSWVYAATPLFCLPLYWQRILVADWLKSALPEGEQLFSVSNFVEHNLIFLSNLIRFDFYLPYANALNILGLVSAIALGARWLIIHWGSTLPWHRHWFLVAGLVFTTYWVLFTSYWWSDMNDAVCSRFYLPVSLCLSVMTAMGAIVLFRFRVGQVTVLVAALSAFALYHPVAMHNRFFSDRPGYAGNYHAAMSYIENIDPDGVLLIARFPYWYVNHGFASVRTMSASRNPSKVRSWRRDGVYSEIYVVQEIGKTSGLTRTRGDVLSKRFRLHTVFELDTRPDAFIRISKVTDIRQ